MKHNRLLFGSISVLLAYSAAVVYSPAASAQIATDTMAFTGTVNLACGLFDDGFGNTGSAVTYTANTGTVEGFTRTTSLTATDTSSFDCNSNEINIDVNLDVVAATNQPFTNATAIDFPAGPTNPGVNHNVTVDTNLDDISTESLFSGQDNDIGEVVNDDANADANGDVIVTVTSTFAAENGAEELGAGTYTADFTVTATAL